MQNVAKIFDMTSEDLFRVARTASSSPKSSPRSGNSPSSHELVTQELFPLPSVGTRSNQAGPAPESNDETEISLGPSTWQDAVTFEEFLDPIESTGVMATSDNDPWRHQFDPSSQFGSELFCQQWFGEAVGQAPDPAYQRQDINPSAGTSNAPMTDNSFPPPFPAADQQEIGASRLLPDPEQRTGAQPAILVFGPSPPPVLTCSDATVNQGKPPSRNMDVARQLERSQTRKMSACIRCKLQRIKVSIPIRSEPYLC